MLSLKCLSNLSPEQSTRRSSSLTELRPFTLSRHRDILPSPRTIMPQSCHSSCSHHEAKEEQDARDARLESFQAEPVRDGNILAEVPYRPLDPLASPERMDEKIEEIMQPFVENR
ncbi:hypothetical protein N656DRAFT_389645 [Canariomyces notabilis]|uniref:Uncharacterized protein n=1 Tax=Canariomyces notabilis TaxID=2074819 RepID=A0AAN6YVU1_9PEZI|nr:hypothetical protein N656DRAFT_389645 [Canariomyces arenarius]